MVPIFDECSKICTTVIDKYALDGRPAPVKDVITRLTLDMTARCAFGYDFDVQHNPNSPFIEFARKFSEMDLRSPEIALKYNDFFQILLSSLEEDSRESEKDNEIEFDLGSTAKGLSKGDILGQAFMFVLAGFETTPAVLHLTIYMLAIHENFQKRCREEVELICGTERDITYTMLSEMKFVDQCISETLRMYPPVVRTNRLCTKEVTIKGIEMKKGCVFTVPIRAIHYCKDFYPAPDLFDPDRTESTIGECEHMTYAKLVKSRRSEETWKADEIH
ncbi:hypothetical protein TELCIR_13013 [Teladorsagia circumcincta]|uniref:Unspecific monooxygenase n=1 Tax=Teladorsagia circumcincta TaxID=45464 RepID=A0A2G9U511_TELCI|nr:hypothetical protein TELCIR_13013 [Teladorsagia circumcincta]